VAGDDQRRHQCLRGAGRAGFTADDIVLLWSNNSKPGVGIQGNTAARFPETDLKQVLWKRGSGQERPKSLI
jgi:hypothetical protein